MIITFKGYKKCKIKGFEKVRRALAACVCPVFSLQLPLHSYSPLWVTPGGWLVSWCWCCWCWCWCFLGLGICARNHNQAEERLLLKDLGKREVEGVSRWHWHWKSAWLKKLKSFLGERMHLSLIFPLKTLSASKIENKLSNRIQVLHSLFHSTDTFHFWMTTISMGSIRSTSMPPILYFTLFIARFRPKNWITCILFRKDFALFNYQFEYRGQRFSSWHW